MHPGFWFLLGAATAFALAITWIRMARARSVHARAKRAVDAGARMSQAMANEGLVDVYRSLESLARSAGDELANLASGIQGHAQLLCESLGQPRVIAGRAEELWKGVRRLRLFSEKILAFADVGTAEVAPLRLPPFLVDLAHEIEAYSGNCLSVELATAEFLPPALASERDLKNAILFLVDALLALETCANRLSLRAYTSVSEDQDTRIELEICADAEDFGRALRPVERTVQLGYHAARNLLAAQDASLSFEQVEGLNVTCFLSLPAAALAQDEAQATPPPVAEPRHRFGGILILEDDQSIRSMMAHELKATGRNVVTCVDGASARSLIEATPERFELLVLDLDARLEAGDRLAALARQLNPRAKIVFLTTAKAAGVPPVLSGEPACVLSKPFGILELREVIGGLLGAEREAPAAVDYGNGAG